MIDLGKFSLQLVSRSSRHVFFTDRNFRVTMVSESAKRYFNVGNDQLVGKPAKEFLTDNGLLKAFEAAQSALNAGAKSFDERSPFSSGNEASVLSFQGVSVHDEQDDLLGYAFEFSFEDSGIRHDFEETLLNNLMRNSQDLVYFKDLNSKFIRVSDSMVERLGAESVDDIIGKSDFDFWDEDCARGFYNDEQEIIRTGAPIIGKAERETRYDGKLTWVLSSKMPLVDESGAVVGTYGISKDITQQKETEQELDYTHKKLLDASRQAGMAEIATNVIHNVGNVLNSINVSIAHANEISEVMKIENISKTAELLKQHSAEPNFLTENEKGKRVADYLSLIATELSKDRKEIQSELESSDRHLQHIKMIVSMQQEYATANRVVERVDISEVLEDAIGMSSGSLERHRITLIREFESGVMLLMDKHRVMQILVNLIRNAKHAVQEVELDQRIIKISVSRETDGNVEIAVSDNGVGISEENLLKLFNHGFTTKRGGHGFGLHSGANSARELGGSLTAHSEGLGMGATFRLTLPVESVSADVPESSPILHPVTDEIPTGDASPIA